ncbi:hypothetical protein EC973_002711 [Apophysomyces ossiformis]|uniref:MoaB/Mog domain-containing protein n=1 Tax=Apophysomyces ossiformis TaxID=679940 RepID=A0A8H7ENG1_9FUNG|nr:hypothetical protein EC973_002711 [Apophysomyces ossiformis]
MTYSGRDIALFVVAFFIPPLAVLLKRGCGIDFLINICLWALGAIPGIVHAFYIVHKYNDNFEDIERGGLVYQQVPGEEPTRVTYGASNTAAIQYRTGVLTGKHSLHRSVIVRQEPHASLTTVSDTSSTDASLDKSGPLVKEILVDTHKYLVEQSGIVPDDPTAIRKTIEYWSDVLDLELIVLTGGTGFAERDTTPEVVASLLTRTTPGITHLLLSTSVAITPFAALSRPVTGIRNKTLIITLPGSPKACRENLAAVVNVIPHGLDLLRGRSVAKAHAQIQGHKGGHVCVHERDRSHTHHTGHSMKLGTPVTGRHRSSPYPLLAVEHAQKIIAEQMRPLGTVDLPLSQDLIGSVLAADVKALEPVPGYQCKLQALLTLAALLAEDGPGTYTVGSVSLAEPNDNGAQLQRGQIARVATGGMVPLGANAVVMVEDTKLVKASDDGKQELEVEILVQAQRDESIREVGSDCAVGDIVARQGQVISNVGGELGSLASVGIKKVPVYRKPRVGVISSGNEVLDHHTTDKLKPGEIRDTNRITLLAAIQSAGFEPVDLGIVKDTVEDLEQHLRHALDKVDVLISTGGVSMGEADYIKPILEQKLNATIHFGRVLMKPGKPTTFATVSHDNTKKYIFALPGNPVSAMVTFYLFVLSALKQLAGYAQSQNTVVPVKLAHSIRLDSRPEFHRVRVSVGSSGFIAESTGKQQSSRLLSLSAANGLLQLPPKSEKQKELNKGDIVQCILIGSVNPAMGL